MFKNNCHIFPPSCHGLPHFKMWQLFLMSALFVFVSCESDLTESSSSENGGSQQQEQESPGGGGGNNDEEWVKEVIEGLEVSSSYDWKGTKISFTEDGSATINPERGFYKHLDVLDSSTSLSANEVKATRATGMTLYYLGFYLTDFMTGNGDISQSYLDNMQSIMDELRKGGAKCVMRFAYKRATADKPWDPSEEIVQHHIEQIKPILQKNADVIFVLQAGFVGVWGEWYYTDNFIFEPETYSDYKPRRKVAEALLEALPESRQIALRTPQFKMRMYNLSVKDTLTALTAHSKNILARIGAHNDCFGASANDSGTFDNETDDRPFWKAESRYTIMGGETCQKTEYCRCKNSLKDMVDYHWSYLNSGYEASVLNRWKSEGCYDEIDRRLGYRFVLKSVERSSKAVSGENFNIALNFSNDGFAAPGNPRNVELVFIDKNGGKTVFKLSADPREWYPGAHTVATTLTLPSDKGTFYLNLSDPLLPDNPLYSIALSNSGVFDAATGYNRLFEL